MTPVATTRTISPKSASSATPLTLTDSLHLPHSGHMEGSDTSRTDAKAAGSSRRPPRAARGRLLAGLRAERHALDPRRPRHRAARRARKHDRPRERQANRDRPEAFRREAPGRLRRDENDLQEREDDPLPGQERALPA